MPNRLLTQEEANARLHAQGLDYTRHVTSDGETIGARIEPPLRETHCEGVNHCWHLPRDWQQGSLQIPVPRLCCWCGAREEPQHGPYAPKGER
jgi:hypothetical protein